MGIFAHIMLDKDKITQNTKRYYESLKKYGIDNDQLMQFLSISFVESPASTQTDYHFCYSGGLIHYMLQTAAYATKINESLPENERVNKESLIKVCLLFHIGKAHLYIKNTSDWHIKKGILYDFNKELVSMRAGERSIHYLNKFGIKLTDEEFSAIINFDKIQDPMSDYHNSMLGELLKMGSILAIKTSKLKK
jgi:hypothetical protein